MTEFQKYMDSMNLETCHPSNVGATRFLRYWQDGSGYDGYVRPNASLPTVAAAITGSILSTDPIGNLGWIPHNYETAVDWMKVFPLPKTESAPHRCGRDWVTYTGFTDIFEYCQVCNAKKT